MLEMNWNKTSENLPEMYLEVLLYHHGVISIGYLCNEYSYKKDKSITVFNANGILLKIEEVDYWMNLPEPPNN